MSIIRNIIWVTLLLGSFHVRAQDTLSTKREELEIVRAERLTFTERNGQKTYLLTGSVVLKQGNTLLNCDSAYLYNARNTAMAYGHVHINQADTVHVYSDSATYDGNIKIARLYENVRLTDRSMILTTDFLTYDLNTRTGIYTNGGELRNQEAVLTSNAGYYYSAIQTAHFKGNVRLNHPDYKLEADTLQYNTGTEVAWFQGPTTIYNENSTVYCEDGYYETVSGIAVFNQHVQLNNPPQELAADSIYYNRETGKGQAYGHIFFRDTSQSIIQYSERADYDELSSNITSTSGSVAGYVLDEDTLFIAADTIHVREDSTQQKTMTAYPYVRLYKSDFQGVCDSLHYSDADSLIRMFGTPVLWSDSTQFSGDSIIMLLRNKNMEEMYFRGNAFIINEDDSLIYNQIKGRLITGYFKEGNIYKIAVKGNGESIYYGKDENDRYLGVNKAVCSDIDILIKDKKFSRIHFKTMPEASFYPMQQINPAEFFLDGFKWEAERRPPNRSSLFEPAAPRIPQENENPNRFRSSQNEG
jgi:lipopolysaccharide export system protein LptA